MNVLCFHNLGAPRYNLGVLLCYWPLFSLGCIFKFCLAQWLYQLLHPIKRVEIIDHKCFVFWKRQYDFCQGNLWLCYLVALCPWATLNCWASVSSEELLRLKLDQISKFLIYASWSPGVLSGYVASDSGVQGEQWGPWVFLPEQCTLGFVLI